MPTKTSAAPFLPEQLSLESVRTALQDCQGCDFSARMMLVGEMPGDREDQAGEPFVGPAGRVLDDALVEAGIERDDVFVTNAVKHFRWEERGKRRLHKKPSTRQVDACKPWLQAEILLVEPKMVVCLGATAAQALMGKAFRITQQRGQVLAPPEASWKLIATWHPSAILRAPTEESRDKMRSEFVDDLRVAAAAMSD